MIRQTTREDQRKLNLHGVQRKDNLKMKSLEQGLLP
jgi:hypothetical protein